MVDISRVSQNVRQMIDDIASQDGKKGISSQAERNALADLLSGGKITGKSNIDYIQGEINNFDLNEAAKNASDFVKKAIKSAMKMTGDKKAIDDKTELAVLDSIINNADGNYSAEDIQYAKLLKAQSVYAGEKSTEAALIEENSVLAEKNSELMAENRELKAELEATKQQAAKAIAEFEAKAAEFKNINNPLIKDAIDQIKGSLTKINNASTESSELITELEAKQGAVKMGKLTKATLKSFQKSVHKKIQQNQTTIDKEKTQIQNNMEILKNSAPDLAKTVLTAISGGLSNVLFSVFEDTPASAPDTSKKTEL